MHVIGLLFLSLSFSALATTTLTSRVHDIDHGSKPEDDTLVFLTNGQVVRFPTLEKALVDQFAEAKEKKQWLEVTLDDNRTIVDARVTEAVEPEIKRSERNTDQKLREFKYVPTTLPNMDVAKELFREARYYSKDSQCFNRAMIWSYEWWKKRSVKSNKILIFFTRNYIRRFDFEWWFHIAPAVHVLDENGKVVERVMDRKYSSAPRTHAEWSSIFMKGDYKHYKCPYITKYSEYANYPYTGECYFYRTNMYTYQPADLEMNEAWGYSKDKFNIAEVRAAYLEAFDEQH